MAQKAKASFPIRTIALVGYFILYVLWLQAIALVAITVLQYAIFNHIGATEVPDRHNGAIGSTMASYMVPLHEAKQVPEPSWAIDAGLWVLLVIVGVLAIIYIGKTGAGLIRLVLRLLKVKLTIRSLFTAKFIAIGFAFIIVAGSTLLLPAVKYIVPLNIVLATVCYILFAAQFFAIRRRKIAIKDIL